MENPLKEYSDSENIHLNKQQQRPYNLLHVIKLTFITAIGGFLFGYDTGVIAGANLYLINSFPDITDFDKETIVSIALIGAAFSSLFGGVVADKIGRKKTILIADVLFTLGAILMCTAPTIPILIIGRFVVGCGVGLAAMVVPVYLAEQSPQEIRGKLITINVLFITGGQFLATGICLLLDKNWRIMLGLAGLPSILQFVGILMMDETPSWLLSQEKVQDAEKSLKKIFSSDDEEYEKRFQILQDEAQNIKQESSQPFFTQIMTLFSKQYRRAVIVGVMLMVWQQLCGINTAMYYGPEILKKSFDQGSSEQDQADKALLYNLPLSGMNALGTVVAVFFIDKLGRRYILLKTIPFVALSLFLVAFGFYQHNYVDNLDQYTGTYIIFFSIIAYLAFFSMGLGGTPWTVNSEIYPLHLRGVGNALSTFANWVSNSALSQIFLTTTKSNLGQVLTFAGLGIVCIFAFTFIYFLLPETKGKSFEEIQLLFQSSSNNNNRQQSQLQFPDSKNSGIYEQNGNNNSNVKNTDEDQEHGLK